MTPYVLLALGVLGAQSLLVVPVVPLLLSGGALAARGEMDPVLVVVALAVGVIPGDTLWFALGRRRGRRILGWMCRAALEPDTCVRRTQNVLGRYGAKALLVAKFVPGLSTVTLPMAGVYGMRVRRFLAYDAAGALLWCGAYVIVGYVSAQGVAALTPGRFAGGWWVVVLAAAAAAYVTWKMLRRRHRVKRVWTDRITAAGLWSRLEAGDTPAIVDLRHSLDFEAEPVTIPGALYIPAEELSSRHPEIPRTGDVVIYCTCPDQATSVKEAMRLRAWGVRRVRLLDGGFGAWRDARFPVEARATIVPEAARLLNAA